MEQAAKSCPKCGHQLPNNAQSHEATGQNNTTAIKNNRSFIIKVAIGVVAVVIVAAAVLFTLNSLRTESERTLTAMEMLDLGNRYLLELNYAQALVHFTSLIEVEPRNARAYIGAAEAHIGLGDIDSAVAILRQGLEQTEYEGIAWAWVNIDPNDNQIYLDIADTLIAIGNTNLALEILLVGYDRTDCIIILMRLVDAGILTIWTFSPNNGIWADDSTIAQTIVARHGVTPNAPMGISRYGYNFADWSLSGTTFTANWQRIQVEWLFLPNGGTWADGSTAPQEVIAYYGVTPSAPMAITLHGHELVDWHLTDNTFTANWEVITVEWTFVPNNGVWANGSTASRTVTENYGITPSAPQSISRDGHTFVNWTQSENTLTANWRLTGSSSAGASPILTHNNSQYQVVNVGMTWDDARAYAERMGGHLVTITSQAEQNFVQQIVNTYGTQNIFWMGGYWLQGANVDNLANNFQWITGESNSFSAFARGTPDSGSTAYRHAIAFVRQGHEGWGWENQWDDLSRTIIEWS